MNHHPYHPANRRGMIVRIKTSPDSVPLPQQDRGPCLYVEGGATCGQRERQKVHQQPFSHKYEVKTRETLPLKGAGSDAPVY